MAVFFSGPVNEEPASGASEGPSSSVRQGRGGGGDCDRSWGAVIVTGPGEGGGGTVMSDCQAGGGDCDQPWPGGVVVTRPGERGVLSASQLSLCFARWLSELNSTQSRKLKAGLHRHATGQP